MAANASGIYVAGNRQGSPGGAGISMYDSLGNELWTREIRVPEPGSPTPSQVLLDATGVYVHGYIRDPYLGAGRRFLRKYTTAGDELWTHFLDGNGNVAVGATGVYAVGRNASGAYLPGPTPTESSNGPSNWETMPRR